MATVGPVGIVGLGLLGSAVAGRLRAAGRDVVGHDVVPERNRALVAIGGRAVASAAAVAEAADPVCVVLPSLAAVEEVVLGAGGLAATARGRTVVQMSTISPALTERLARECAARGVAFLDCPISGTSGMVARGDGIIFAGGERAVYERWRPLLEAAGAVGAAVPLTDVAERLYAAAQAAGHGGEDLAVVVTALARR